MKPIEAYDSINAACELNRQRKRTACLEYGRADGGRSAQMQLVEKAAAGLDIESCWRDGYKCSEAEAGSLLTAPMFCGGSYFWESLEYPSNGGFRRSSPMISSDFVGRKLDVKKWGTR